MLGIEVIDFVDSHRQGLGVKPLCKELRIAPSIYYLHKDWQKHPDRRSNRFKRDEYLVKEFSGSIKRTSVFMVLEKFGINFVEKVLKLPDAQWNIDNGERSAWARVHSGRF